MGNQYRASNKVIDKIELSTYFILLLSYCYPVLGGNREEFGGKQDFGPSKIRV